MCIMLKFTSIKKEKGICLPNKAYISGRDEKVGIRLPNAQYICVLLLS